MYKAGGLLLLCMIVALSGQMFLDVTDSLYLWSPYVAYGVSWIDYNRDGRLDLYVREVEHTFSIVTTGAMSSQMWQDPQASPIPISGVMAVNGLTTIMTATSISTS